jgi:hypothetical protein
MKFLLSLTEIHLARFMKTKILAVKFLFTTFVFSNLYAQTVTIPDPEFVIYLQANYPACMTGDQLETSCPDIINATEIYLPNTVTDLFGIQFFLNASLLETNGAVTNIIDFPPSLGTLNIANATLSVLPDFPPTLINLYVANMSQLISLPALPPGMGNLIINDCSALEEIPDLSGGMIFASIMNCPQIDSIPALPANMTTFEISNSPLVDEIPSLPPNLGELFVEFLPLVNSIPDLPPSLFEFWCVSNDLYTLPDFHEGLQYAVFYGNPNLKCLPVLPQSLLPDVFSGMEINLTQTQITCLPNIPPALDPTGLEICLDNDLINNPNACDAYAGMIEINSETISVYPNPSESIVYFALPEIESSETITIEIISITGEKIIETTQSNLEINQVNLQDFTEGIYILKVSTADANYVQRISKCN